MVELVELFLTDGLFVGPASQPVTNDIAPKANKIRNCFMLSLPFPPCAEPATRASTRQSGTQRDNRNSRTPSRCPCDTGPLPPRRKKSFRRDRTACLPRQRAAPRSEERRVGKECR